MTGRAPGPALADFEALAFETDAFDHRAHVYVAWQLVRTVDLLTAIRRYREMLIRLTRRLGVPDKYHETITWYYLLAVAEAARGPCRDDWATFEASHPRLFEKHLGAVRRHYSSERLHSPEARRSFLLPDLAG